MHGTPVKPNNHNNFYGAPRSRRSILRTVGLVVVVLVAAVTVVSYWTSASARMANTTPGLGGSSAAANDGTRQQQQLEAGGAGVVGNGGDMSGEDGAVQQQRRAEYARLAQVAQSAYDFSLVDADGAPYDLTTERRGKVTLFMNVASQCGFTKRGYEMAVAVHGRFSPAGFSVVAFPCNQFGAQEPKTAAVVKKMMAAKFGVTFPLMEKADVNGPDAAPLFRYLQAQQPQVTRAAAAAGGFKAQTGAIEWNFASFLVDPDGKLYARYPPGVRSEVVEADVAALMSQHHGFLPRK
jgi:glutathione peroxidase